jgi:hypothetical protein
VTQAILLGSRYAPIPMLTGDEAALPVQRKSVCADLYSVWKFAGKDRLAKNREYSRRGPLHDRVGWNIAEQQIPSIAQPDWPFGEQEISDYFFDGRTCGNDFVQRWVEPADASYGAGVGCERQNCACARQHGKKLPLLHKAMLSPKSAWAATEPPCVIMRFSLG